MSFGSSKGAGRWLEIPIIGNFQPSEIAKFILVVYTARMIAKAKDNIKELETFKKLMIPIIVIPALIFPQNFSTASILFVTCFTMLFLGNVNSKHWLRVAGAGLLVSAIAFCIVIYKADNIKEETTEINTTKIDAFRSDTWMQRIIDWRADDKEANTQINTARKAIATGSLTGVMPGNTIQGRLLSESHNDFIYAIIIEELGFIGGISLLFLYSVLFFRCIVIARNCNSTFRSLTVSGLGLLIYLQALINMGVAVGYLPVTGQTLPFISYGGTSYLFTGCAIGMIQSICESFKIEKRALEAAKKNNNELINNKTINE
jgi:cell division protein FtsW